MIDIRFSKPGPAGILSNLHNNAFVFDGIECASMEGVLHAFKFRDLLKQAEMCKQHGYEAKLLGASGDGWRSTQTLHWMGKTYDRNSECYQQLITRAYMALIHNIDFQRALLATVGHTLTHRLGSDDPEKTVITENEFITRLVAMRRGLQGRRST